jgi:dihydrofolate synthase/folylpolyglutamate synthase
VAGKAEAPITPDTLIEQLSVPAKLGTRPTLDRVRALLASLGNPERGLPVVHIGGTSGKGSTATILGEILRAAGLRVGLHTKPHLERVEERFVLDGRQIPSRELLALLEELAPTAREVRPSWHELTTAVMLRYFQRERVDVAVVEVGLGGTHDSTNVVEPLVAVLTNVGLDHTEVLGDTVEEIARDKVGILKPGCRALTGARQQSVLEIVQTRCREIGIPLGRLGAEVRLQIGESSAVGSTFDLTLDGLAGLPAERLAGLRLDLVGEHQVENAALATASARWLSTVGIEVPESAVRAGLGRVRIPGRLEQIHARAAGDAAIRVAAPDDARGRRLVLDGAHNPDKMAALAAALATYRRDRFVAVLSLKRGHDHRATMAAIAPLIDKAYLTRFVAVTDFGRDTAAEVARLAEDWRGAGGGTLEVEPDPVRAVARALAEAAPDDLVLVTGSLYLVGQVRRELLATRSRAGC